MAFCSLAKSSVSLEKALKLPTGLSWKNPFVECDVDVVDCEYSDSEVTASERRPMWRELPQAGQEQRKIVFSSGKMCADKD